MEWRAENEESIVAFVVPDTLIQSLLAIIQPTGIPLDPYQDSEVGCESVPAIAERLRQAVSNETENVVRALEQELRVSKLPSWAIPLLDSRLSGNLSLQTWKGLLAACEHAMRHGKPVRILGQ